MHSLRYCKSNDYTSSYKSITQICPENLNAFYMNSLLRYREKNYRKEIMFWRAKTIFFSNVLKRSLWNMSIKESYLNALLDQKRQSQSAIGHLFKMTSHGTLGFVNNNTSSAEAAA